MESLFKLLYLFDEYMRCEQKAGLHRYWYKRGILRVAKIEKKQKVRGKYG